MDLSLCTEAGVTVKDNNISCERKIVVGNNMVVSRKRKKEKRQWSRSKNDQSYKTFESRIYLILCGYRFTHAPPSEFQENFKKYITSSENEIYIVTLN